MIVFYYINTTCPIRELKKSSETIKEELLGPLVDFKKKYETRLDDTIKYAEDTKETIALIKNNEELFKGQNQKK